MSPPHSPFVTTGLSKNHHLHHHQLESPPHSPHSPSLRYCEWREYVSGWTAAVFNIVVTFPINKTMFRQVVHGISVSEALGQLRKEGLSTLYRGLLSPLLQKSASSSLMFGSYFQYQRCMIDHGFNSEIAKFSAGFLSGCTEATLAPLERVQVLMQDKNFHDRFRNTPHALMTLRQYGYNEYYRGLTAILLRNGPSNVMFFTARERIKDMLPVSITEGPYSRYASDFLCGACLGALISTLFYPVNVTKTHMQLELGGEFKSFKSVFRTIIEQRGLTGMFKGVHVNCTRSFLSWGIINVTYEYIHKWLLETHPLT